ncbi:MAG: NUDIX domain-containing protein [Chloroflexi bacterium]|nr:NUDIX domain-containing protein [Chloroflexota bacterium]
MAKYVRGERIGRDATLTLACDAVIFDPTGERMLLTRRTDNNRWCLPGGRVEAGESVAEACAREVLEETGLTVSVGRLIGVYSDPHRITQYADGNRCHFVVLSFEATVVAGQPSVSAETLECGYFTADEIARMDVVDPHIERIADAWRCRRETYVR